MKIVIRLEKLTIPISNPSFEHIELLFVTFDQNNQCVLHERPRLNRIEFFGQNLEKNLFLLLFSDHFFG